MPNPQLNEIFRAKLTDQEFDRLSQFISQESGIKMPPAKRIMLQSRLYKRLRALGMTTFGQYCEYVFGREGMGQEITYMLDVVSTNRTDFFREPVHFDFLTQQVLPEYLRGRFTTRAFRVWSAGCSSGEEPYTVAMVLQEFASAHPRFHYAIAATDLSTRMLERATLGIYKEERTADIPFELKQKYLLRSRDRQAPTVRISPELRQRVKFGRLNFMAPSYDLPETFDVIFCRNVLIYFDRDTQEQVIQKLCARLRSGGYLFLGHSESIMGMRVPLKPIRPTIFLRA